MESKKGKRMGRPPRPVPADRRAFMIDRDINEILNELPNASAVVNLALREHLKKFTKIVLTKQID